MNLAESLRDSLLTRVTPARQQVQAATLKRTGWRSEPEVAGDAIAEPSGELMVYSTWAVCFHSEAQAFISDDQLAGAASSAIARKVAVAVSALDSDSGGTM